MNKIPKALADMVNSNVMLMALDRTQPAEDLAEVLAEHWSYDLFARKPGAAHYDEDGKLQMTDLDLACFLSALVKRGAVINIPEYKSKRVGSVKTSEKVVSEKNRHGKVLSLVANKETFSFSIKINDMNVITTADDGAQSVGAPRNFMLVGLDGEWNSGWSRIEFTPSAQENEWLNDKKLWTGQTIFFKNFVYPTRWTAFYGAHYLITKVLIERLEEESEFLRAEEKRLNEKKIFVKSAGGKDTPFFKPSEEKEKKGKQESIKVDAFQCEVDAPWLNEYAPIEETVEALTVAHDRERKIHYKLLPQLRFATRGVELAFYKVGMKDAKLPFWMKDAKWEEGFKIKGKRNEWNRMSLTQLFPGTKAFALRYRTYQKSERVAVEE